MRKLSIILIALLTVLLVFVSCDEAIDDGFDSDYITLKLEIGDFVFDNGTKAMEMKIPSGCETWGDLIDKGWVLKIKLEGWSNTESYPLKEYDSQAYYFNTVYDDPAFRIYEEGSKGGPYPSIGCNEPITVGETYIVDWAWPST